MFIIENILALLLLWKIFVLVIIIRAEIKILKVISGCLNWSIDDIGVSIICEDEIIDDDINDRINKDAVNGHQYL